MKKRSKTQKKIELRKNKSNLISKYWKWVVISMIVILFISLLGSLLYIYAYLLPNQLKSQFDEKEKEYQQEISELEAYADQLKTDNSDLNTSLEEEKSKPAQVIEKPAENSNQQQSTNNETKCITFWVGTNMFTQCK
jgi:cell division protein FtsB